ncbi:GDSL-type esterase/lipase family protein [Galbibacter pacificus]|uniref:GDSL-type esterase/lipase family protein n=1 Tax=Galbibacter pacificus TaxID=2996052 RepID=A0ABT6FMP1_9FLAO|nr:GDSL-type esterase/lipase family protein [Galbibacter pacificus]MDG3581053.1 GDSL-type esterase/lipase family protein [Galbibacter pacificus]MDG3584531.1 GDSL-type esterase/lipase family protein [Galbibacter pacificus]
MKSQTKKSIIYLFPLFILLNVLTVKATTKIVCIGASITYGAFIENRDKKSFPSQLQYLLGPKYKVFNYGVNGTTMLKNGDNPYWETLQYREALISNPDIVVIDLGGNDSKQINRKYLGELYQDAVSLIKNFKKLKSTPRIIVLLPVTSFVKDKSGIWDPVINKQIIPSLQQAAMDMDVEVIDMHPLLIERADLYLDMIHPNRTGLGLMAGKLCQVIIQPRDQQFKIDLSEYELIQSSFYGYKNQNFLFNGRQATIVEPKIPARGHPWIWRARFFRHEPQVDIALLEMGFYIVYIDTAELLGNKACINHWNSFYAYLKQLGLSKKGFFEGMSRGAIYVLNWASQNPDKIQGIYLDNPVLDMKSWPIGLGSATRDEEVYNAFLVDFKMNGKESKLKSFMASPINQIDKIVSGDYPILILCADSDKALPPEENTFIWEAMRKRFNGNLTIIHKPGYDHHPHSLENPYPIVQFISNQYYKSIK